MATLLLIVIYIAFIGLGLPDSLLGAAWPVAHADLGAPISAAGYASVVITVGTVISSLVSAKLIKRFGTGLVTMISVCMTATALLLMGFVKSYWPVLLLAVPLGLGAGTVDTALNNFVALHYKASHMNWLHCFWGIGATGGPMIMSLYLTKNNWQGAYRTVSIALFCIVLILLAALPLWRIVGGKQSVSQQEPEADAEDVTDKRILLRRPGAVYSCVAFACYCSVEYVTGLWASTYFVNARGIAPDVAASWASLFFLGITFGRLAAGFVAMRLNDRTIMRLGAGACLLGLLVLALPLPAFMQAVGLALMGLGCAPMFPGMLDETPKLFGRRYSQGMMGLQFATAYAGGSLMPLLFGALTPHIGVGAFPYFLLVLFGLFVFCLEARYRSTRDQVRA